MNPGDIFFEAKVIRINRSEIPVTGIVEFNKVQAKIDLSLLTNIVEGSTVFVCGRTALSTVEEAHEICG